MAITVTQLAAFLAVMRSGSVTAAAEELEVTQPSVSSAVATLARELDCELLQRSGRGIEPTAAGRAFAAYASDAMGLLDSGRRAARESAENAVRELRLAVSPTAAETFVPGLLQSFTAANPGVEPRLTVAGPETLAETVAGHVADLAIIGQELSDPRLTATAIGVNSRVCVVPSTDPLLTGTRPVPASALADRVWLLREPGSSTRRASERYLGDHGIAAETLTLGSNTAIKRAVISGLGVALLSSEVVADELATGSLVALDLADPVPAAHWYAVHAAVGPVRPVVSGFIAFSADRRAAAH
jgi:LysR family transcriptional regulator, low CO2-responsive transcriptional regulator